MNETTYNRAILEVASKMELPKEFVDKVYMAYWKFIKHTLETMPIDKDGISKEDFVRIKNSINIPSLGKMGCTYVKYEKIRKNIKRFEEYKASIGKRYDKAQENQTDVQQNPHNCQQV